MFGEAISPSVAGLDVLQKLLSDFRHLVDTDGGRFLGDVVVAGFSLGEGRDEDLLVRRHAQFGGQVHAWGADGGGLYEVVQGVV